MITSDYNNAFVKIIQNKGVKLVKLLEMKPKTNMTKPYEPIDGSPKPPLIFF